MSNQQSPSYTGNQIIEVPGAKESFVSKIIGGFSWWINSLTGRPQPKKIKTVSPAQTPATPAASSPKASSSTEVKDSVGQDLEAVRNLVSKLSEKVTKNVAPVLSKGIVTSGTTATKVTNTLDKGFMKKILRMFFVVLLILVLLFIGMQLFRNMKKTGDNGSLNGETPTPSANGSSTPTPEIFEPGRASIYAEDPVVLKLEGDINLLTREISGTNIKETLLNPPTLDFNVSF